MSEMSEGAGRDSDALMITVTSLKLSGTNRRVTRVARVDLPDAAYSQPRVPDGILRGGAPSFKAAGTVVLPTALCVLLPALIIISVPDTGRSHAWPLTVLIMVWAGFRLSQRCLGGEPHFFDFFFWLYVYLFLGLAPTIQLRADAVSTTTAGMDPVLDVPIAVVVIIGLVCYEIGRFFGSARNRQLAMERSGVVTHRSVQFHQTRPKRDSRVSPQRTLILAVVALVVAGLYYSRLGTEALQTSREAASLAKQVAWPDPVIRALVIASAIYTNLVVVGALAQLRRTGPERWRGLATGGFVFYLLLLVVLVNPLASARYTFGTVAFAVAIFLGAAATRARIRTTMIGTVAAFFILFPLGNAFRRIGTSGYAHSGFFSQYMFHPDYDGFWQIGNAYSFWEAGLATPLKQITGSFLFWVPRSVWAGKPTDTGILLANYRGYSFTNLSAPLWAESFINGGYIALVIVFVAVGYLLARLDSTLERQLSSGGVWAIAGAIYPVYMVILLRGSLLQATGAVVVSLACVLFLRSSRREPAPAHRTYSEYSDSS